MDWPWFPLGPLSKQRLWTARFLAAAADVVQIAFAPVLAEGALSPLDDLLDGAMCIILTLLIGWHIAFLPSFLIKLTPMADLAPTWTIAVLIATTGRTKRASANEPKLPPEKVPPALPPVDAE